MIKTAPGLCCRQPLESGKSAKHLISSTLHSAFYYLSLFHADFISPFRTALVPELKVQY